MRFKVQGQSMYPYLKPLDEVELINVPRDKVKIGDIVVYFDSFSKIMIVHRVVGKNKVHLIVKGDNNWKKDDRLINSKDVWIVDKIYKGRYNINSMHSFYRRLLNLMFVFLSISRINFFLHGKKIRYTKKIGGRAVTDKVYMKYEKYIDMNNQRNL